VSAHAALSRRFRNPKAAVQAANRQSHNPNKIRIS
jgi:hypothetical protein